MRRAGFLILVALGLVSLLFISVDRRVGIAGKILPAREWVLAKNNQGEVLATFSDFRKGSIDSYTVVSVIRGDAFRFAVHPSLEPGDAVSRGDTIVRIDSHDLVRELQRLSGELAVARATLTATRSGEKEAVVQQAERELVLARENSALQTALFDRQDSLYQKNLVSRELYDLARSSAQAATISSAIAEARLRSVTTGAKPEDIRTIQSQIDAFERQIRILSAQLDDMTLLAPFAGIFLSSPGTDTLCTVEDTSQVALIPVPVEYRSRLSPGQSVTLRVPPHGEPCEGTMERVDRQVRVVNGRQVILAIASLNACTGPLPSRLVVGGTIVTERVTLAGYLRYWFTDLLAEVVGGTTGV